MVGGLFADHIDEPDDGADELRGNAGNDSLYGKGGNDELYGGDGSDNLSGEGGNDLLVGSDFAGQAGTDIAIYRFDEYTRPGGGATFSLNSAITFTGLDTSSGAITVDDLRGGTDTLVSIEAVLVNGTRFGDTISLGTAANVVNGLPVPIFALFDGRDGNDILTGGAGNDRFTGGNGNDRLDGGSGGIDTAVYNYSGFTDPAGVFFNGSSLTGANPTVTIADLSGGQDTLINIDRFDVTGTAFADFINGANFTGAGDLLIGGAGADTLNGLAGADVLDGGTGDDRIDGGDGSDAVRYDFSLLTTNTTMNVTSIGVGTGDLTLIDGVGGTDTLISIERAVLLGSAQADTFRAGAQSDQLNGNGGNDTLYGYGGGDIINGGDGDDTLVGGQYTDHISQASIFGGVADGADTIHGDGGNDVIRGGDGNDQLFGDAGNDNLRGDLGNDLLNGGDGIDFVSYRFDSNTGGARTYDHGHGLDLDLNSVLIGTGGNYTMDDQRGGTDTLVSIERIGIAGTDYADTIRGKDGMGNQLGGSGGDDILIGRNGDDILTGDAGKDIMTGGAGADIFVIDGLEDHHNSIELADVITDFTVGTDQINFTYSAINPNVQIVSLSDLIITQGSGAHLADTIIQASNGDYLGILQNVTASQITSAQFIFNG